ncbi:hypothetical protein [Streptomyces synnematoformans]|uniref:Uncharacterized protein n=1 Tax=Streptomyces synnematoformans TaxID=415721 RepID=A0ABN2XEH3_9ACTN
MVLQTLERPPERGDVSEEKGKDPQQAEAEERINISARVRVSIRRRARLYAAAQDVSLQDVVDAALDEYLSRRDS